jgi:hypothetical protein
MGSQFESNPRKSGRFAAVAANRGNESFPTQDLALQAARGV